MDDLKQLLSYGPVTLWSQPTFVAGYNEDSYYAHKVNGYEYVVSTTHDTYAAPTLEEAVQEALAAEGEA